MGRVVGQKDLIQKFVLFQHFFIFYFIFGSDSFLFLFSLVGDVGEEVGDGLPVVGTADCFGEHHGDVDALKLTLIFIRAPFRENKMNVITCGR